MLMMLRRPPPHVRSLPFDLEPPK